MADVVSVHHETASSKTLRLRIPGLTGHLAGQHVAVRLTAEDGYTAVRSYSVASALTGDELEITVEQLADGEVSPYLVHGIEPGAQLEVRGPVGGWFVWKSTETMPVQLIGGGSGVVPLMSMMRSHASSESSSPFRLLYSVRSPETIYYRDELKTLALSPHLSVDYVFTREAPEGWPTVPQRLDETTLVKSVFAPSQKPRFYVCGATAFVETVSNWLLSAGHDASLIRTERFGGTGG